MAEVETNSALIMDRGLPLGNSDDTFGRRALHVKVGNKATEPIPVTVTGGVAGTPFYADAQTSSTPGVEQTLITAATPASPARSLDSVVVACRTEGRFTISDGATIIGSGRTGPATPNARFSFSPRRTVTASGTVTVKFTARSGAMASDVEAYLQAVDG
jgi:hypothetical protein